MNNEADGKNRENENAEKQRCYRQKMDAVTLLAGNMAHDFNNHLTVINGYADILLEMIPQTEEPYSMIGEIRDAVVRSQKLTGELLEFSREKAFRTENVNINDVLGKLKSAITRRLNPAVELEMRLAPELPEVQLDPLRLEKTIMNLVTNALDAMPDGGKLTIHTSTIEKIPSGAILQHPKMDKTNRYVALKVQDTGIGMDKQTADRIFEPFFTVEKKGTTTGLGLSNVYGFVKQICGKIEVQSTPATGTAMVIYLPGASG